MAWIGAISFENATGKLKQIYNRVAGSYLFHFFLFNKFHR